MNKKIISFILCIMLLMSITILAFAGTDISKIKTDAEMSNGATFIVIGGYAPYYYRGNSQSIISTNKDGTTIIIPP